ncbi:MAG TPA: fimbria/pilus outer membrane usher protein, partial [Acidobacteriaceae bacterium]|nr:fimbria/pilus outer membrane usher protein [Acidobacteriaceae bacterium]
MLRRHDRGSTAARGLAYAEIVFLVMAILPQLAGASDPVVAPTTPAATGPATGSATSAASSSAAAADSDETLLLDVQINGHFIGKIGEFTLRHGKLLARPDDLRDLGFRVPVSRASETGGLVSLSDLPGLTWILDQKNQVLQVTASDSALLPTLLQPIGGEGAGGRRVIESGTGVTLNYDTVGTFSGGQKGGTGSMEMRAFSPRGIVSSEWLVYAGATPSASGKTAAIRLDSAYTFADVNTLRRYSLGDFITGGLAWTRPVRLEGAQIYSDFSMRPDLVTFPMPSITGSTAVPSTVNVLADGNLTVSSQIAAGPFEIPQLPVVEGAGTISMTVTNALGQQVTLTQPFYASSAMLAPGLQTFAVQSGLVRRNWGSVSNDYGKMAAAAIYRRGLSARFTFESSVEDTPGAFMLGLGGVAQIGNLGVVNFAVAPSYGSMQPGVQFSVGAQRIGRVFSLGASAITADRDYRDMASVNGNGVPRKQISAFTGLSLKRFGSGGLAYAGVDQDASPTPLQQNVASPQHSQVVSANYSLQIHHVFFYATEFRDLVNKGSSGLQVGLTIPFRRRDSVSVSGASDGSGQVQVQQPAPMVGDWGYQAFLSAGDATHVFAQGQYKSPVGLFTAGVDNDSGVTTLRIESQGALSFVDRGLFPSNTIYDSFAIVDTSPVGHVHVLQENRDVGSTNSSGRLLVPDMRSFDLNHVSIEATDIPPEATINNDKRELRPQDRSGVVVKFPIRFSHGALLRLVDEAGVAVPMGSTATLRATGTVVPVGYDGDAYVEDLSPHNQLTVERMDGRRCTVAFDYKSLAGDIPSIGPLRCFP